MTRSEIENFTTITAIRSASSLDKYLGFPILKGRAKKADFDFIVDKMQSRLASWKHRFLNKAGRLALATSVLSLIPSYYMQIFWMPQSICNLIDRTTRDFIWKGITNKGVNLVGWNKISCPKKLGGLGVTMARDINTSLLGKLVWDMQHKPMVQLLSQKYVKGGNMLDATEVPGASHMWSSIYKTKEILWDGYNMRIGNGLFSFWYTPWKNLGPLCMHVPYVDIQDSAMRIRDVFINHKWHLQNLVKPHPEFVKDTIMNSHIHQNSQVSDTFIWEGNIIGTYTAKSGFQ